MQRLFKRLFSRDYSNARIILTTIALFCVGMIAITLSHWAIQTVTAPSARLLTDPFLQLPTEQSVQVIWFTEFEGDRHWVEYGDMLEQKVTAQTSQLSRVREDQKSRVGRQIEDEQIYTAPVMRDIWRHEASVSGLVAGQRLPYRVVSQNEGQLIHSDRFSLAAAPLPGQPLKILLTSDHQLMPLTPANLQKVVETVGQVDAVFLAGDLVNIPDRASEWFDDNRGNAFFPSLQGRANYALDQAGKTTHYHGGAIIQSAPLVAATGNHEVMGRFSATADLNAQFNDPYPQSAAARLYTETVSALETPPSTNWQTWLNDHSFNTITFNELFSHPLGSPNENYYALTFGDIRLIVLYATNIWRSPNLSDDTRGRYRERLVDLFEPQKWGYGQHIFEPIAVGSPQYQWLQSELASPEFFNARYKVVMFHHPMHSLGDNIVPAYTDPQQQVDVDAKGTVQAIRYEYPLEADYLIRDVAPLLEEAGVHLVFFGHSHVWNRFISADGMNYLESSNVGNTYGAFRQGKQRKVPIAFSEIYAAEGDPNGLEPVVPTIAPLIAEDNQPLPFIASNDITAFSILDTAAGTVSSYRFDTRTPEAGVVKFDEFAVNARGDR